MIEISNYKELVELYRAGKLNRQQGYFRIVQEISAVLLGLCGYTEDIPEPVEVTQQEIDWLQTRVDDIDFMHYLGGNVFIVEAEADLAEVVGMDFEFSQVHRRWPNCMEAILPLDEAKYLFNADGTADYALLFAATNDAGGPSWFIPRHLWQAARIAEQIEAHQQFWSAAA